MCTKLFFFIIHVNSGNGYACADIDECREDSHSCDKNANCTNNIGSYTCACNNGYRG